MSFPLSKLPLQEFEPLPTIRVFKEFWKTQRAYIQKNQLNISYNIEKNFGSINEKHYCMQLGKFCFLIVTLKIFHRNFMKDIETSLKVVLDFYGE